ncbi:MAG TPA: hypothetical protein VJ508_09100 [Saprospiraceae bacterium]|nr:hypothetical protein [Saprospiraceae bacterium]
MIKYDRTTESRRLVVYQKGTFSARLEARISVVDNPGSPQMIAGRRGGLPVQLQIMSV